MQNFKVILFSLCIISCSSAPSFTSDNAVSGEHTTISSKRISPKYVRPIVVGNHKYSASMNEIVATELLTDTIVWKKKIYTIVYDESLEKDIQDAFIDSISLVESSLFIRNKLGEFYLLNLKTKEVLPYADTSQRIQRNGYAIMLSVSSKDEYDSIDAVDSTAQLMTEKQCIQKGIISVNTMKEFRLKLSNGDFYTLKNDGSDEQFSGYSFIHYDVTRNIYVLWENWLEAGHPIMINGTHGVQTELFGKSFCTNKSQSLTANFAEDIGSGWTPNGIQILGIENGMFQKLFDFDPSQLLNDDWGPVGLRWKDDSTILIKCIVYNSNGGYSTLYKKLKFELL